MVRRLFAITSLMATTALAAQDTTIYKRKLLTPQLYWDYGKTATLWTNFEKKTEIGAGVLLFERIDLSAEYGLATLNPRNAFENIDYTAKGSYFRLGIGYLASIDPRNKLGLEARYAFANYQDSGDIVYATTSGYNTDYLRNFSREDFEATWTEINLVSQRYLTLIKSTPEHWANRLLSIGLKIRYRMLISSSKTETIPPIYAIPGYGRAESNNLTALNFFIRATL
jgi:hypothetical protein